MDKTSKKVTKDPRRLEQGKKSYETSMKRLKEKILEDNQPPTSSTSAPTCDPHLLHLPLNVTPKLLHLPLHMTLHLFMVLVCLLYLPLLFVYFFHITLPRLKIKNTTMITRQLSMSKKSKINHQNDVIYLRKIYTIK